MRFAPYALSLCVALAVPVAAHADTVYFTYTQDGGSSINLTLDPSSYYNSIDGYGVFYEMPVSDILVIFLNPAGPAAPSDFIYADPHVGDFEYDGVQLYSGPEDSPTFLVGTYALDGSAYGNADGTLVISNSAPTPEPSSFFLLGTGILGFAGTIRRRFSKS